MQTEKKDAAGIVAWGGYDELARMKPRRRVAKLKVFTSQSQQPEPAASGQRQRQSQRALLGK